MYGISTFPITCFRGSQLITIKIDKCLIAILVFTFLLPLSHLSAAAQDEGSKEVISTGVADGKSARARDEALNDALRKAVEQGVGTYVTTELTVEQQKLVEDRIYTESRGYIQNYKVLHEGETEGLYEVKISALVKMGKLADDLQSIGLIIRKKQNPRVMVVMYSTETNSSFVGVALEGNRNAENQLESNLIEKGFQLVDAGQVERKKQLETLLLKGDPSRAGKIARDYGAEILVQGEVRRTFVDQRTIFGRPTRFFSNEIRLKALETDTGKVLFSGYKTSPASGAEALLPLQEATSELAEEMIAGILQQWRKDVFQAGTYQLNISKATFNKLSKFKQGLLKIRGLQDIQTRSYQSGHALLEIKYQGPLEQLAEKISQMKDLSVEVVGLQSNSLDLKLGN
jgi:nucleotide-binding universal stress UspA family protein